MNKVLDIDNNKVTSFRYAFPVTERVAFVVENNIPSITNINFATYAFRLNEERKNVDMWGQCQEDCLTGKARSFYMKWNNFQHRNISVDYNDFKELLKDIEELKQEYSYMSTKSLMFSLLSIKRLLNKKLKFSKEVN